MLYETLDLLMQAKQWQECIALIQQHAADLYASGRRTTLTALLQNIPFRLVSGNPTLQYWYGLCLLPSDLVLAKEYLQQSYRSLRTSDDTAMALRCWSTNVDALWMEWRDCTQLDYWIEEIERYRPLVEHHPEYACMSAKGAFTAMSLRKMDHPDIQYWEALNLELLERSLPLDDMVMRALQLMIHYTWGVGDRAKASIVLQHLEYLYDGERCSHMVTSIYHVVSAAYKAWFSDSQNECLELVDQGLAAAEASGLHHWDVPLINTALFRVSATHEEERIEYYLDQLKSRLDEESRPHDVAIYYYYFKAYLSWLRKEFDCALVSAEKALSMATDSGFSFSPLYYAIAVARIRASMGQIDRALQSLAVVRRTASRYHSDNLVYLSCLVYADILYDAGAQGRALVYHRHAVTLGSLHGYQVEWWVDHSAYRDMAEHLLTRGVESDYLRARLSGQPQKQREPDCYIVTLGRCGIEKQGKESAARKLAKVPLSLMLHLIAINHGKGLRVEEAIEYLWPGVPLEKAYPRLKASVQRLRAMLGGEERVSFSRGRLQLTMPAEQVDCWQLEQLSESAAKLEEGQIEQVFQLYQGEFQDTFTDSHDLGLYRAHLHAKFCALVHHFSERYQMRGEWETVLVIYDRALQRDHYNEGFVRGKLRALRQLNKTEELLSEFNTYQNLWQNEFDTNLSTETARLAISSTGELRV